MRPAVALAQRAAKRRRTSNSFDEIASSHRLPQGLGPRQLHRRLQQGFATGEMGLRGQFAQQQSSPADVRFVPKADILRCSKKCRYSITWSSRYS
jgi:hypothetical protein